MDESLLKLRLPTQEEKAVPVTGWYAGYGKGDLSLAQAAQLDEIAAEVMACKALPTIDATDGVVPVLFPDGYFLRPWGLIVLDVIYRRDRKRTGQRRADEIAYRATTYVYHYPVAVWLKIGGKNFYSVPGGVRPIQHSNSRLVNFLRRRR